MKKLLVLTLSICFTFVACKKSDRDDDTSTNSAEDFAFTSSLVYDVFKIIHQASSTSSGIVSTTTTDSTSVFGCDTIIFDGLSDPKTLMVNLNNECESNNILRKGAINVSYDGFYDSPGTTVSINLYDYSYNEFTFISGNISYRFNGIIDNYPTYAITFSDVIILNDQNQKVFYSGNHQLKIITGSSTPTFTDDQYQITGTTSGRAFKGNSFSAQITEKFIIDGNCNWVLSGQALVKPASKTTRHLDYGNGCNNKINVSLYNINYELEMP